MTLAKWLTTSREAATSATDRASKPQTVARVARVAGGPSLKSAPLASAPLAQDLERKIRAMGDWWRYSIRQIEHALAAATKDPHAWRDPVEDDERWRIEHPDRRPTVH